MFQQLHILLSKTIQVIKEDTMSVARQALHLTTKISEFTVIISIKSAPKAFKNLFH